MNYELVITTCGREGLLARALESFETHVRPRPDRILVLDDSGEPDYAAHVEELLAYREETWGIRGERVSHRRREGFCQTVAHAWGLVALRDGPPYVFWLEDDFLFGRAVNLEDLAYTLERQPQLAQMSLLRQAVSDDERDAGGVTKVYPERFEQRGSGAVAWLEHRAYWTTNPSLFRREFPERYPWPIIDHCEGIFTAELIADRPQTTFGIWGVGEPWVVHAGDRAGVGY